MFLKSEFLSINLLGPKLIAPSFLLKSGIVLQSGSGVLQLLKQAGEIRLADWLIFRRKMNAGVERVIAAHEQATRYFRLSKKVSMFISMQRLL